MKEIIKILKNYKLEKKLFFITLFILVFTESTFLVYPQILKGIMEIIEQKGDFTQILYLGIFGGILLIFSTIGWLYSDIFLGKLWGKIYYKKNQFYRKKLLEKNYSQIVEEGTGNLISRFERGVRAETDIFISFLQILTNFVLKISVIVIIFVYFFPKFLILLLFMLLFLFGINFYISPKLKEYTKQENLIYEKSNRILVKMIQEFFTIKVFGKQKKEINISEDNLKKLPILITNIRKLHTFIYISLFFFIKGFEISLYIIFGYFILKGELNIALLVMLVSYLWVMWNPIESAIREINRVTQSFQAYKKLASFIEQPNEIKNGEKNYIYKTGKIEFKNVDFGYSKENKIFKKLNLEFLSGKKNALVGHSGGGKSTIIKILLRLYDYKKGEILLDNQELKSLKIESFYKEIGYLPQEPGIFDGTIRENMEYAFEDDNSGQIFQHNKTGQTQRSAPTENVGVNLCVHPGKENQIWEALEKAQISDMIKKLEHGLDTEVGEKGVKLSGGEKQRLAIARIFLKNPKIIILDEPTSALDSISEAKITKALDKLMKNKTAIIIAHRLQTVMHSDKIIVLENGKIEAEGKHSELMQKSKVYKTLVDLQNGEIIE